jgi:hypothetical protein
MQGNRKDLEWRTVEEIAKGNSGTGVFETAAASSGRDARAICESRPATASKVFQEFFGDSGA